MSPKITNKPQIIVVYQPHQNIRQHSSTILSGYFDCFDQADFVYWLPTFLSRENDLPILSPAELLVKAGIWDKETDNFDQNLENNNENSGNILEKEMEKFETNNLQENVKKSKFKIAKLNSELEQKLNQHRQNGDLIIFMGAGNIDKWAKNWVKSA